jgi:hypothetical protein
MPAPKVTFSISDGNLGRVAPSEDGVTLLVLTVPTSYAAFSATKFLQLSDAEAAGITEAEDTAEDALVWEHIKDFYAEAGDGTELHVLRLADTVTMANIFTAANAAYVALKNKLSAEKGRIRLLGVCLNPASDTGGTGITADLAAAIPLAQTFWESELGEYRPIQMFLEGRLFTGTVAGATSLRTFTAPRVSVIVGRDRVRRTVLEVDNGIPAAANYAAVGLAIGRAASIQVQRNIGRVRDGQVSGVLQAELSGDQLVSEYSKADIDALYDKGYVFLVPYVGKDGFYWIDDSTAVAITSDFAFANRGRTIDKAIRLTYGVMIDNLKDNVDVDPSTGKLDISTCKAWESDIENAVNDNMTAFDEIEGVTAFINPDQNVLTTDEVAVAISVVPKGMARAIVINIGFATTL